MARQLPPTGRALGPLAQHLPSFRSYRLLYDRPTEGFEIASKLAGGLHRFSRSAVQLREAAQPTTRRPSMNKLSIRDLDLKGKRVFIRVDFNVPMNVGGQIVDDTQVRASLPTIQHAMRAGARVILASHLGRPKGGPDPQLTLRPVAVDRKSVV